MFLLSIYLVFACHLCADHGHEEHHHDFDIAQSIFIDDDGCFTHSEDGIHECHHHNENKPEHHHDTTYSSNTRCDKKCNDDNNIVIYICEEVFLYKINDNSHVFILKNKLQDCRSGYMSERQFRAPPSLV